MADLTQLQKIVNEGSLSAPDITKLTTGVVDGTGAFDKLMVAAKAHLLEEYNESRITGDEYSSVYLGMLQGVLQQAIQFLISHQHEEKTLAEIGYIRQQTVTELAQTDDLIPDGLGFNDSTSIEGLVAEQKLINAEKINLAKEEVEIAKENVALTQQKVVTELAQTDDDLTGLPLGYAYNDDFAQGVEGVIALQKQNLTTENLLKEQQVISEVANVSDTLPTDIGKSTNSQLQGLIKATLDKSASDAAFTYQKTVTEQAQTDDTIDNTWAWNGTTSVEGMIKLQKDLADQQILESIQKVKTAEAEVILTQQKAITELAQTEKDLSKVPSDFGYNVGRGEDIYGLVEAQLTKTAAEGDLIKQKVVTEVGQVSDVLPDPLTYGMHDATTPGGILALQTLKTQAEVNLLDQKTAVELAQTEEDIPTNYGIGLGGPVTGVIGKQKVLFERQADGFLRDAEQKLAKIMGDTFNSGLASDAGQGFENSYFDNVNIGKVISKAMEGINADTVATSGTSTLDYSGQPNNGETVTIGAKTYTWVAVLSDMDGYVHIGASTTESIDNLIAAIKLDAGAGTAYAASTTAHPNVLTLIISHVNDTMPIEETSGLALETSETMANANWSAPTT